jgi:tagatose-6-phosphate ketose/aldose isomerase
MSMSSDFPGLPATELESRGAMWTTREIAQQPQTWVLVEELVADQRAQLDAFCGELLKNPSARIVLTGAGTSSYIGQCLAPSLSAHLHRRVDAIATTDLVSAPRSWLQSGVPTLLVSFARSGNSPESVAAVDLAERELDDVRHLIITCNATGRLAARAAQLRAAHVLVLPEATNDRGFAMTSSFSSMLLVAALTFGTIHRQAVAAIAAGGAVLLERSWPLVRRLVGQQFKRVVYLGSNELRGLASEAGLKLLELTDGRITTLADSPLGFRHGPKSIVNDQTLVVVMLSNSAYTRAYDLDLLEELRRDARAGAVVALTARREGLDSAEHVLVADMSEAADIELALLYAVVAQSYALAQSLALGLRPDRPNASGVVNRVVQGVTIHPWRENRGDVPGR